MDYMIIVDDPTTGERLPYLEVAKADGLQYAVVAGNAIYNANRQIRAVYVCNCHGRIVHTVGEVDKDKVEFAYEEYLHG